MGEDAAQLLQAKMDHVEKKGKFLPKKFRVKFFSEDKEGQPWKSLRCTESSVCKHRACLAPDNPNRSGDNRGNCVMCSKGQPGGHPTSCVCSICEVHLCVNPVEREKGQLSCFEMWHQKDDVIAAAAAQALRRKIAKGRKEPDSSVGNDNDNDDDPSPDRGGPDRGGDNGNRKKKRNTRKAAESPETPIQQEWV